jgi:iron(III) transport system substrate-binding protein
MKYGNGLEIRGRREFLIGGAAALAAAGAGVLTPAGIAHAQDSNAALYAAARKEGKLIWRCGHLDQPAMRAVADAFMKTYPGIDVDALWQSGEVVYTRVQQNLKAGVNEIDVFGTSNAGHWPRLKQQGVLVPFQTSGADKLGKTFKTIDPDHMFHAAGVEVVIINYRSDKVSAPPKRWTEMLDPAWDNKLTFGNPAFSGDAACWTVAMLDKYGQSFLTDLAKRNPKIGRSILGTGTDINSGERLVGHGVDANTFLLKRNGNPIDVQFPEDDAILAVGYTGILKDCPHPSAAKLFIEFNDSIEYSKAMAGACRFPIRSDVPSFSGLNLDDLKSYKPSIERLSSGTAEAVSAWRAAMGV